MIRAIVIILLSLTLSSPGFAQSSGAQFHVHPQGDDANSGDSPTSPFRSIQHALQLAQPGDTVHFADGHYYQDVYTVRDGVHHLRVLHMTFRKAGEECLRVKYFARRNEVAYSSFQDCGIWDFVFHARGEVGEAVYLGPSSKQWDINLTIEPDVTAHNWARHNVIRTNGNDGGGIKMMVDGQGLICGNQLRDNAAGDVSGGVGADLDPAQPCEGAARASA